MVGGLRPECSKVLQEMNLFCLNNEITEPESSPFYWCHDQVATLSNGLVLDAIAAIQHHVYMKRAMMTSFGIIKYPMAPTLACPGYPHPMANEILKLIELIIKLLL